jgi:hypothetical protein
MSPGNRTAREDSWGCVHIGARNRSTVEPELALRPEFSTRVRMPPTAHCASRGGRRGLLVLTAGLVPYFYRRYTTGPVVASLSHLNARGFCDACRAELTERREGPIAMTRAEQRLAARRRGELSLSRDRDHGSRRPLMPNDVLNAWRADSARTKGDPLGPSDRRYAYLTQSHD